MRADQQQHPAQTYPCPICISERVAAAEHACATCQEAFSLVDEQAEQAVQRVVIGPTDI